MSEAKAVKKPNPALMKPLRPSNELAAVVGSSPLPRTEVVGKVWDSTSLSSFRLVWMNPSRWTPAAALSPNSNSHKVNPNSLVDTSKFSTSS
jgi:chromatin remodeling complex protein RSC6